MQQFGTGGWVSSPPTSLTSGMVDPLTQIAPQLHWLGHPLHRTTGCFLTDPAQQKPASVFYPKGVPQSKLHIPDSSSRKKEAHGAKRREEKREKGDHLPTTPESPVQGTEKENPLKRQRQGREAGQHGRRAPKDKQKMGASD